MITFFNANQLFTMDTVDMDRFSLFEEEQIAASGIS
jgi:hypothetical protein